MIGVCKVTIFSKTARSSAASTFAPPPRTKAITSNPLVSRSINRLEKSTEEEKLTLYSRKSIAFFAALIPALKSAIVIDVVAKTSAIFGRSSVKSFCSNSPSTFL